MRDNASIPHPPRYIAHDEIRRCQRVKQLFAQRIDLSDQDRLSHPEEILLFKRMHCYAYRMNTLQRGRNRLTRPQVARYLRWYDRFGELRNRLFEGNIGLAFDLLGKTRLGADREELRSEGLFALLRAVDTFNPWRGFRFSTYACNSIVRAFMRVAVLEAQRRRLHRVSLETVMEPSDRIEPKRTDLVSFLSERIKALVDDSGVGLSGTEKYVLKHRFPLQADRPRATLKVLGGKLKLSKERVRQIQQTALEKLRQALLQDPILQS